MAKRSPRKNSAQSADGTDPSETSSADPGMFEKLGQRIDSIPEVQAAEEAVAAARAELEKAQEFCTNVRQQAQDTAADLRDKNFGDLIHAGLSAVRKHPAAGVSLAFVAGVYLGRLFRK